MTGLSAARIEPSGAMLERAGPRESVRTWANLVTAIRTAIAVPLGLLAAVHGSPRLLLAAYLAYWLGDIADGAIARVLDQETRIGAVLDVVADRACAAMAVVALALIRPGLWPALAVFVLQFMVLDAALTLAFLRWPIKGPNDFHLVDRTIWRYNWSKPAKSLNTAGVVVAAGLGQAVPALLVALALLTVKVISTHRLLQLTA